MRVDDYAIVGAYAAVHQFTRIGAYSFLVHSAQVTHDVPPFMLVKGYPSVPIALNLVALRRHGFHHQTVSGLKKAFRIMYRQNLPLKEVETALEALVEETPEVGMILDVMNNSKRGLLRKHTS